MGVIPNTGSEIAMGRVRNAYGLSGAARLRADLAAAVNNNLLGSTSLSLAGQIRLSIDFGGRQTPSAY